MIACTLAEGGWGREGDSIVIGGGISRTHDSNIFRLSDNTDASVIVGSDRRGDEIQSKQFLGRFDKTWGRQRLKIDADLRDVSFANFKVLDYRGTSLQTDWGWTYGNRLSGNLRFGRETTLTGFGDFRPGFTARNIDSRQNRRFDVDYWLHSDWHADASIIRTTASNSTQARKSADTNILERAVAVRYDDGAGRDVRLRGRWLDGHYPGRIVSATFDDGFRQQHVDLTGRWLISGKSRLTGGIGTIDRSHEHVQQRDYSGLNGQVGWEWGISGKTAIEVNFKRELSTFEDFNANFLDTRTFAVTPTWAVSEHFLLQGRHERRGASFDGDPGFVALGLPSRFDRNRSTSLNARYMPRPWITLTGGIQDDRRDSNVAGVQFKVRMVTLGLNAEL